MAEYNPVRVERTTVTAQGSVPSAPKQTDKGSQQTKKAIFRTYQFIWYILGVFEALLGFRFLLKAFAANPGTPFVQFIYSLSGGLVRPFTGIFPTASIEGSVLEWVSLVAIAVYAVVAYGLVHLFQLIKPVNPKEVEQVVDNV